MPTVSTVALRWMEEKDPPQNKHIRCETNDNAQFRVFAVVLKIVHTGEKQKQTSRPAVTFQRLGQTKQKSRTLLSNVDEMSSQKGPKLSYAVGSFDLIWPTCSIPDPFCPGVMLGVTSPSLSPSVLSTKQWDFWGQLLAKELSISLPKILPGGDKRGKKINICRL